MARFVINPGLDQQVAQRFVRTQVDRLTDRVETEAKRLAPPAKVWVTRRDERVRPSHVHTDGQEVPDNLRYKLPKAVDDNVATNGWDLARAPRDPDLPVANRIHCRCESVPVPEAIAREIHRTQAVASGTRVRAEVYCTYPRGAESEFGTDHDTGAHFMSGAVDRVAAESRGRARAT